MAKAETIAKFMKKVTPEDIANWKRAYNKQYREQNKERIKANKEAYYRRKTAEAMAEREEAEKKAI